MIVMNKNNKVIGSKLNASIDVTAYKDKDNKPTCAIDFESNHVCPFYRTIRFGCDETCAFAVNNELLDRRSNDGTLIPLSNCPIWNKNT